MEGWGCIQKYKGTRRPVLSLGNGDQGCKNVTFREHFRSKVNILTITISSQLKSSDMERYIKVPSGGDGINWKKASRPNWNWVYKEALFIVNSEKGKQYRNTEYFSKCRISVWEINS